MREVRRFKLEKDLTNKGTIISERDNIKLVKYYEINDNILDFEEFVWGYNSDDDLPDENIHSIYTIEETCNDGHYMLGYIIILNKYFVKGDINKESSRFNPLTKRYADIADLVILDMRKTIKEVRLMANLTISDISENSFKGIVLNPNDNSAPLIKRLEVIGIPIKYYNYPSFYPDF